MNCRIARRSFAALALAASGCVPATETPINTTPASVVSPAAPDEAVAKAETTPASAPKTAEVKVATPSAGVKPVVLGSDASTPEPASAPSDAAVNFEAIKFDALLAKIAANKDAKFTLVDAWATFCPPCLENFPHVVQMHAKYAGQGLAVYSLSMDDPGDAGSVKKAREFLASKGAALPNFLLDEEGAGFDKLNINAIPAVFVFGPDGKEVRRYTMDDPNKQFTYDEVEKDVVALLGAKAVAKTP